MLCSECFFFIILDDNIFEYANHSFLMRVIFSGNVDSDITNAIVLFCKDAVELYRRPLDLVDSQKIHGGVFHPDSFLYADMRAYIDDEKENLVNAALKKCLEEKVKQNAPLSLQQRQKSSSAPAFSHPFAHLRRQRPCETLSSKTKEVFSDPLVTQSFAAYFRFEIICDEYFASADPALPTQFKDIFPYMAEYFDLQFTPSFRQVLPYI